MDPFDRHEEGFVDLHLNSAGTILFAERPQICQTGAGESVHTQWGVGFYSPQMPAFATLTPVQQPDLWSTGQVAPVVPLPPDSSFDRDSQVRVRVGTGDAAPSAPSFPTSIQLIVSGRPCDPRLPGSMHRGGMNAAMSHGSVRFITSDISFWVFWATCVSPEPKKTLDRD